MIYKNLIVKVEPSECKKFQKFLFHLKYNWIDITYNSKYQITHRQIKIFKETVYFIIDNSSNFKYYNNKNIIQVQNNAFDYSKYKETNCKQIMRKLKLEKLKKLYESK